MAKCVEDVERPVTSGKCAVQCRDSSKVRNHQDEESQPVEQKQDRSFDLVKIKYLKFDIVKCVIFTKVELNTGQERECTTFKIDSGSDSNLMPFRIFRTLFPKSTIEALHSTKTAH